MGSVFKRENGKSWYIKYDLPKGADGKRQSKMQACPGMTKREAENALAEIERRIRRGEHTATDHTVKSFLLEWLDFSRPALAGSTAAMYEYVVNAHIIPELGRVKLDALTPLRVQTFYKHLKEGSNDRRALSPKSILNIHRLLHKALEQAVKWNLILHNPCDRVEVPKQVKATAQAADTAGLQKSDRRH